MDELDETLILKYLQGECSEDELRQVNSWLQSSDENAKQLFLLEETFHSDKRRRYATDIFLNKAEQKLDAEIAAYEKIRKKSLIRREWLKYAAILLLCIGIGRAWLVSTSDKNEEITVSVAKSETVRIVTLPDGSKVWINQNSTLKYPRNFSKDQRHVSLSGEAYFEVSKDRKRPFYVNTEALTVRVLGTTFNLKCLPGSNTAETSLIEGEVEVKGKQDEGQIVLAAGQKAELNRTTKRLHVKQVDTRLDAVWHNDLIPFAKASIFEIAGALERFYNVKIILSPEIDTQKTYSGVIPRKESIESVLNALKNSIPIQYKISGNNIYIQQSR